MATLFAFTAEQQALLRDLAINHFSLKKKIIAKMKDLYPGDAWEFTQIIREKFFQGRQKDREYSLEDLQRMLSALNKGNTRVVRKDSDLIFTIGTGKNE
jgi:hypothetical protein